MCFLPIVSYCVLCGSNKKITHANNNLRQNIFNHFTSRIRQSKRPALELVSEFLMIKPKLVQDGRLYVKWLNLTADRTVTNLIGFSIAKPLFYTGTCHPNCKSFCMMISSLEWHFLSFPVFQHRCATKFTTPNY